MYSLYRRGLKGRGITIALVDSFGSPTIRGDLARFDSAFHLRAPPSFRILQPAGRVPSVSKYSGDRVGWLEETSIDVEYAHAMAPGANILLIATPTHETVGVAGFPEMVRAETYVISHGLAQVMSLSFGAGEQTFPGARSLLQLRSPFLLARRRHVTVVVASGDNGPTTVRTMRPTYFAHPVVNWPASDPLVTALGGTRLQLDATGHRLRPDVVWNDSTWRHVPRASGGGTSRIFGRPQYQQAVRQATGPHRGVPDISMTATKDGGALVYVTIPGRSCCGFMDLGGTSLSAPVFAGIAAIADQAAERWLGLLNPRLYARWPKGIRDITRGNTNVWVNEDGRRIPVRGYAAVKGFDLATGLGTVNGPMLVRALSRRP